MGIKFCLIGPEWELNVRHYGNVNELMGKEWECYKPFPHISTVRRCDVLPVATHGLYVCLSVQKWLNQLSCVAWMETLWAKKTVMGRDAWIFFPHSADQRSNWLAANVEIFHQLAVRQ